MDAAYPNGAGDSREDAGRLSGEADAVQIRALTTFYAGCRFRSRLEARWAVFFDELGVDWSYEPQGYTVGPDATPYLPDFWLPSSKLWVEVKGQLDHSGLETLIYAASSAGLPRDLGGPAPPLRDLDGQWTSRILVLGQIPAPGTPWLHSMLESVGDYVLAAPVTIIRFPTKSKLLGKVAVHRPAILNSLLAGHRWDADRLRDFVDGVPGPIISPIYSCGEAYRAARSARFEHGEHG